MLDAEGRNGTQQNGHGDLPIKPQESERITSTNSYVPDPVTGRDGRTNAAGSGPEHQVVINEPVSNGVRGAVQAQARNQASTAKQPEALHYFSYLGRVNRRPSKGLVCAHSVLTSKPVIVASTSFVTPNVMGASAAREGGEGGEGVEGEDHAPRCALDGPTDVLECCTCVCCVKAVFYHCTKDTEEEGRLADHPCSCQGHWAECVPRWSILGVLSVFLPCLWCYVPFVGCGRAWERGQDWLADRKLRAHQARLDEAATETPGNESAATQPYEPANLRRQEALRVRDPYDLLQRNNHYVNADTLTRM